MKHGPVPAAAFWRQPDSVMRACMEMQRERVLADGALSEGAERVFSGQSVDDPPYFSELAMRGKFNHQPGAAPKFAPRDIQPVCDPHPERGGMYVPDAPPFKISFFNNWLGMRIEGDGQVARNTAIPIRYGTQIQMLPPGLYVFDELSWVRIDERCEIMDEIQGVIHCDESGVTLGGWPEIQR